MRVWRIAHHRYALDKTCMGAAQFGGRWNPIGMPALYCGETVAVCALEKFVHLGAGVLPAQVLVAVDLPDDCDIFTPERADLPAGWDDLPTSLAAQRFGAAWLRRRSELALKVPSAIVQEESNLIINPLHPDYARLAWSITRPFVFDRRMFRAS